MYTGIKFDNLTNIYLCKHPSYINRFPKEYEEFKNYLESILDYEKI